MDPTRLRKLNAGEADANALLSRCLDRILSAGASSAPTVRTSDPPDDNARPDIAMLLDVDREYRGKAAHGSLQKIAPKRFNPTSEAWLPILHTERDTWHFTVLFSNTARAHDLKRTDDWVVVYFHSDSEPEGQHTIVTETRGSLIGKRVVRGREQECRAYYETSREDHGQTSTEPKESRAPTR